MKKLLFFLGLILTQLSLANTADFLVCNLSDLRAPRSYPEYVSTLVISPEVDGKRYFTSMIMHRKNENIFSGIGPLELESFNVDQHSMDLRFPNIGRNDQLQFKTISAQAKDHYFHVYHSTQKNDVQLFVPRRLKKPSKNLSIECYALQTDRVEWLHASNNTSGVTVDQDGVQSYTGLTSIQARDLQISLLYKFLGSIEN